MKIDNGKEWIRKYARIGLLAKGIVYILIGGPGNVAYHPGFEQNLSCMIFDVHVF